MHRRLAGVVAVAGALSVAVVAGWPARAQTISPSISPARIHVETPLGQGETVQLPSLAVANQGDETVEVHMAVTPAGEGASRAVDPAWLRFAPSTFELAAGEATAVALWLDVPRSAPPGDYRARLRADVRPAEAGPGIQLSIRAAVATDLRFTVEERHIGALDPLRAWWRRNGLLVALLFGTGALTFGSLKFREDFRLRVPIERRAPRERGEGGDDG